MLINSLSLDSSEESTNSLILCVCIQSYAKMINEKECIYLLQKNKGTGKKYETTCYDNSHTVFIYFVHFCF